MSLDNQEPIKEQNYLAENLPVLNTTVFGEVAWLMTQSNLHRNWAIGSLVQWIVPALITGQYRLYRRNDRPIGYVAWGRLSATVETYYARDPSSLQPKDWKSGDRLWLLDWISPSGDTRYIANDLKNNIFPSEVARGLRWKKDSDTLKIFYLHGKNAIALSRDYERNPTVKLTD